MVFFGCIGYTKNKSLRYLGPFKSAGLNRATSKFSRKNGKDFQSLEILQKAKCLEGFAFQYLVKKKKGNMEMQKIARKKYWKFRQKSFDKNCPYHKPLLSSGLNK